MLAIHLPPWCLLSCKDTNFKANHNSNSDDALDAIFAALGLASGAKR